MDKKTTAKATASKVKATTKKTTRATKAKTTAKKTPVTEKKKTGRPKKVINQKQFEEMCKWQCTRSEIASFFDCDEKTITTWCKATYGCDFSSILKRKAENGKTALRHIQFRMAEAGSERMAIWLGKQWLNQTDKQDIQIAEIEDSTRTEIEDFLNDNESKKDPQ